jgi:hypothetical protein
MPQQLNMVMFLHRHTSTARMVMSLHHPVAWRAATLTPPPSPWRQKLSLARRILHRDLQHA